MDRIRSRWGNDRVSRVRLVIALAFLLVACHAPGRPCLTGFDVGTEGGREKYKTPGYQGDTAKVVRASIWFHFETVPGACDPRRPAEARS